MDEFVKRHKALHAQLNDKTKFYRLNREEVEELGCESSAIWYEWGSIVNVHIQMCRMMNVCVHPSTWCARKKEKCWLSHYVCKMFCQIGWEMLFQILRFVNVLIYCPFYYGTRCTNINLAKESTFLLHYLIFHHKCSL